MISPQAYVDSNAQIGKNVTIYPFAYIDKDVVIGDDCVIMPYVSVMAGTRMGRGNRVFQNTVLGAEPQDFNYKGDDTTLIIGDENVIRENVVINRATYTGGETRIGNRNSILEGVHISHDTKIADDCVFGYGSKIAGDCIIENNVIFSSQVVQNPKTRVGQWSMVQAGRRFSKDVPPYIVAVGSQITYGGVNATVLRNNGFEEQEIKHIATAYRLIYHGETSIFDTLQQIREQVPMSEHIEYLIQFIKKSDESQVSIIDK